MGGGAFTLFIFNFDLIFQAKPTSHIAVPSILPVTPGAGSFDLSSS